MAYNDTENKQTRALHKDHAIKLLFEAQLVKKIRLTFRQYVNEFFKVYSKFGYIPAITDHRQDVLKILQQHYARVSDRFSKQIVKELGKPENYSEVQQDIESEKKIHHVVMADKSATYIASTTHKNANDAIKETILAAAGLGLSLSRKKIAQKAKLALQRKLSGRLETIGISDTNNSAEHAKQTEIQSLIKNEAKLPKVETPIHRLKPEKTWRALLDNVTRPTHADADGQRVPVEQPYFVGGESLMVPRDDSLGASISNTINCRCSSIISF